MKLCLRCGERPARVKWCRECAHIVIADASNARAQRWYEKNKLRALRTQRAYRARCREERLAYFRARYTRENPQTPEQVECTELDAIRIVYRFAKVHPNTARKVVRALKRFGYLQEAA